MPRLSELRGRLAKAQTKTTTARLSNAQCIDLLLKVCSKRSITLVPTLNGDELLTLRQLESDIVSTIESCGGRALVSELASTLGVQQNYVDRAVEKILREQLGRYTRLQDTLITTSYTEKLMVIASSRLDECGLLDVCEFAAEFELPFDLIKLLISGSSSIKGHINGNLLESHSYEACKERCVGAAVAATTVPTSTLHIASVVRIDANLVNEVVQRLVKSGKVQGSLKGSVYTPLAFTEHRLASLTNFYSANGYIEVAKVADVLKPCKESPDRVFPGAVTLESVILDGKAIEPVSVLVNEAIANASWRDIGVLLPGALTGADIVALLGHIKGAAKGGYVVEGLYVARAFEDVFVRHVVDKLTDRMGAPALLDAASGASGRLFSEIDAVIDDEPESTFAELWMVASRVFYGRIEGALVAHARKCCSSESVRGKGGVDVDAATDKLKVYHMKIDCTLKVVEKLCGGSADNGHLIMKTMVKELLPCDCHLLLQLYASQNYVDVPGESGEVCATNRGAVVDGIKDKEVKADFRAYLEALKQKDALRAIESSKSLKSAMYISCNVKKEKKGFIKSQTTYYQQQLAVADASDVLRVVKCSLLLAVLRSGHYVFMVDKDWCLKSCVETLGDIVNDAEFMSHVRRALYNEDAESLDVCRRGLE